MRIIILSCLLLAVCFFSFYTPSTFAIKGKILDEADIPIVGVTVKEKGKTNHVVTNASGEFSIEVSSDKALLVLSMVGYQMMEVAVKSQSVLNIHLKASSNALQEVEVAGEGYLLKKDVSSGTSHIRADKLANAPTHHPGGYLRGSVAGVAITNSNVCSKKRVLRSNTGVIGRPNEKFNTEDYDAIEENRFLTVADNAVSTFSIDVDAASYSNVRRYLQMGELPPAGSVRIEELINYFHYDYPQPLKDAPFSINTEIADCPWNSKHRLVLIGLQGKKIPVENLPASNIVFLIDVSGSMMEENKLPLVKTSLKLLVDQLREQDKVSLVVYAGNAGLVLPSTSGAEKAKIKDAIDALEAGGSTAGGQGIQLAYRTAKEHFVKEGNNRVILCTDGDFNVGVSSDAGLEKLIEEERNSGVFLTVLGYGMGNYKDNKMQKLADKGNGNHAYIDGLSEAKKVLVNEFGGTLFTLAKDVKLQVEFNPGKVQAYRLIGYENRMLNKEDFNNDIKDAGELGSGHTVTALYEIIPEGVKNDFVESVDKLKYQPQKDRFIPGSLTSQEEIMTIKFRYKKPDGDISKLIEHPVIDRQISLISASSNFRFAAAVAEFGMLLRNSEFKQSSSYTKAWQLAKDALGKDEEGYRSEFLKLLKNAQALARKDWQIAEDSGDEGVGLQR